MLVVVFSLLDKQDLPAKSLSPVRPVLCQLHFLEGGIRKHAFGGCRKQLAPATLWPLFDIQPVLETLVSSQSWEIKQAVCTTCNGTSSYFRVASPGVGVAGLTPGYPQLTARRRHQSLYSGISESVTCKPTPIPHCLTCVYFVWKTKVGISRSNGPLLAAAMAWSYAANIQETGLGIGSSLGRTVVLWKSRYNKICLLDCLAVSMPLLATSPHLSTSYSEHGHSASACRTTLHKLN